MELLEALTIVIKHLDEKMVAQPSQKIADASNLLEEEKAALDTSS